MTHNASQFSHCYTIGMGLRQWLERERIKESKRFDTTILGSASGCGAKTKAWSYLCLSWLQYVLTTPLLKVIPKYLASIDFLQYSSPVNE